ncbi:hypothetical protein HPMBJEAJ_00044 [Aeromonas phage avDM6]|nr:hypothetical protein HPMBJEAJ_00044 [Aeromonas phage avDM6]
MLNFKYLHSGEYCHKTNTIKIDNTLFFFSEKSGEICMSKSGGVDIPMYRILNRNELNEFEHEFRQVKENYWESYEKSYRTILENLSN